MFKVFLDESGTHRGSPITAVGGFIGPPAAWESLEQQWPRALTDCGVKTFRSYDCQNGVGHFAGISQPIRLALVQRLARIIAAHDTLVPVWSAVVNEDWDRTVTPNFLKKYPEPIYLAFEYVASLIAAWSQAHGDGAPVGLVYSEQEEFKGHIRDIWDAYKHEEPRANFNSFTIASHLKALPLQAADLLAYEMNQDWQDHEYGTYGVPPPLTYLERKPLAIIREKLGLHRGGEYDALAIAVAMRRAQS